MKANQILVETVEKISYLNEQLAIENIPSDDNIVELIGSNQQPLESANNLKAACKLIQNEQLAVKTCNAKSKKCTNELKQTLYPTLEDIMVRIAELAKLNVNAISPDLIQSEKIKLQQLADDINTGILTKSPKEKAYFDTFTNCLTDAMKETETVLLQIFNEITALEGVTPIEEHTNDYEGEDTGSEEHSDDGEGSEA